MNSNIKQFLLALVMSILSINALANGYSNIFSFGDSVSDGGNSPTAVISYYKLFGDFHPTDPGYSEFRFTNGPTAVENLATRLNLNATTSFFNYAVGGATTSQILDIANNFSSINNTAFGSSSPVIDNNSLFFINGGANDLAANGFTNSAATAAASNLVSAVSSLYAQGARNFLISDIGFYGDIPNLANDTTENRQAANDASAYFSEQLTLQFSALSFANDIKLFNQMDFAELLQQNPVASIFTNTVAACLISGVVCNNPNEFVFWDGAHTSAKYNEFLGEGLFHTLNPVISEVPIPAAWSLFLSGLLWLGFSVRFKKYAL